MTRILLVTNDFPPRRGGIQSYLEQFVNRLAAIGEHQLTVYAPHWQGAEGYDLAAPLRVVTKLEPGELAPVPTLVKMPPVRGSPLSKLSM